MAANESAAQAPVDISVQAALFRRFMQGCWEAVRTENGGAPNVYGTAERIYEEMNLAKAPVLPGFYIPIKKKFINGVRREMLQPEIFRQALFSGASKAVKDMSDRGPVVIWTAGDMYGGKDSTGRNWPGSMEQLVRVLGSGVLAGAVNGAHEVNVSGAENKFRFLATCLDWLGERKATEIVVLEDKLGNLREAHRVASDRGASYPIWVRQGTHGATSDEAPLGVHSLQDIAELPAFLDSLSLKNPGFLVDYDGVLSDDARRRLLQQCAVFRYLYQKNWITQGLVME